MSHGSLLIRSLKGPGIDTNVDLICVGVEYPAAPRHLRGLEVEEPTPEEITLFGIFGKSDATESGDAGALLML